MPDPSQSRLLLEKARRLAATGKSADALNLCLRAHTLDPESDGPVQASLALFLGQRRHADALNWLKTAAQSHLSAYRAAALLDLMRMTAHKRDTLTARAEAALTRFPDSPQVLLSAGAALQAAREPEKAEAAYARRLALMPDDAATLNNLAQCRCDRGQLDAAVAIWRGLTARPELEPALRRAAGLNLARALLRRGDANEAESLLRGFGEQDADARRLLAAARAERGDVASGLEAARAALREDPGDSRNWLRVARLVAAAGDPDGAVSLLERGANQARNPLSVRLTLAGMLRRRGCESRALALLERWSAETPDEVKYPLMLGAEHERRNRFDLALFWLGEAERRDWKQGGLALVRFWEARDQLNDARRKAREMRDRDPSILLHHGLYAEVCHSLGLYDEALDACNAGLARDPANHTLCSQKVRMLMVRERFAEGVDCAKALTRAAPLPRNYLLLLGALRQSRRREEALALAARLHDAEPDNLLWLEEHAAALALNHRTEEAARLLEAAHRRAPDNLKISSRLLACYRELDRHSEAEALALSLRGDAPDDILALSGVLRDMGRLEDALDRCREGMARYPSSLALAVAACDLLRRLDRPEEERELTLRVLRGFPQERALTGCALALIRLHDRIHGRPPALESPDMQAVIARIRQWGERTPDAPGIWWAQVDIAEKLGRVGDAMRSLDAIERRFPNNPAVLSKRADLLSKKNDLSAAIACRRKALALRPTAVRLTQSLLDELVKAGDFSEFDSLMARIKHLLGDRRYGYYRNLFFNLNCHPDYTPEQIWEYFRDWYEKSVRPGLPAPRPLDVEATAGRRLRLGYVSPDFRRHSMAYFMEPIFRAQQEPAFRDRFEVFAYAHLDVGQSDQYTELFKKLTDHWTDISAMSDDELERVIRHDRIDILIDMAGHTANNRLSLFLRQPAPVQAGWIYGYVQTTGLPQIDWMVCDAQEVPPEHEPYMAERRMARFSFAGHPYAPPPEVPASEPLPCLTRGYVTFGVTTRLTRVNERCIRAWAAILARAPSAKLRFQRQVYLEPDIQQRVLARFAAHGIGAERIEFRNVEPLWAAYSAFDCHLDTFPVGYVTTLYEGLWMERPCVSLKARPPMGRVGWGTMNTLGLGEWCSAETEEEYIARAARLGNDPNLLTRIATGLRERMRQSPLMDYPSFGRELAALYHTMWKERTC